MNILDVMTANEGYCARHTDTPLALQDRAKLLCWQYNQTRPDEGGAPCGAAARAVRRLPSADVYRTVVPLRLWL